MAAYIAIKGWSSAASASHSAQAIHCWAQRDAAIFSLVVGIDHKHKLVVLIGTDRTIIDQQGLGQFLATIAAVQLDAGK